MITVTPFQKNLNRTVTVFQSTASSRKGLYLDWYREGHMLRAEISPLQESLLPSLQADLENSLPNYEALLEDSLSKNLNVWDFKVASKFSQIRFAISSLFLEARNTTEISARLQGFLDMKDPELLLKTQRLIQDKISVCKFKIDKENQKSSLLTLQKIMSRTKLQFRVDANQSLTLEEAIEFARELPRDRIDYLEEPLQTPQLLEQFYSQSGFPYALDENIVNLENFKEASGLKALVVKPTLIGDFPDLKTILENKILPITISSTYETDVGLKHLILWAQVLNPQGAHGLDTFDIFEEPSRLQVVNGHIAYV